MSSPPDLDRLARRYLDLWQDQMNRMANDPATAEMMSRTFSLLTKSAQAFTAADAAERTEPSSHRPPDATAATAQDGSADDRAAGNKRADGSATTAAVSGDGGVDVAWLVERITALEERVAVLEQRPSKSSGSRAAAKPDQPGAGAAVADAPVQRPRRPARRRPTKPAPPSTDN